MVTEKEPIYIEVVTSPECPYSPQALKVAKQVISKFKLPVVLREVSVATDDGQRRAQEFEVSETPTIAINGRIAYIGVPSQTVMKKLIDIEAVRGWDQETYFF